MERFLDKHHSKFNQVMETIYKLVIINFLAIISMIAGLIVFGVFPAIMTSYILIRRMIEKDDFPLFKTFTSTYKLEFVKANKIGYIFVMIWVLLSLSWFFYLRDLDKTIHQIGLVMIGFMAIATFFMTCYLPICYAYFKRFKTLELFKFCLIIVFGMPVTTLMIALSTLFFYAFVMLRFITIFPFLAISLPAFINMILARKKLIKIFTLFQDDFVSIRTLNSYYDLSHLWHFIEEEVDLDLYIDHLKFQAFLNHSLLDYKLSLVLLDEKEIPKGLCLVFNNEQKISIVFMLIAKNYQRRKYGKKMLETIFMFAKKENTEMILLGDNEGIYEKIPRGFYKYLTFFRTNDFLVELSEQNYIVSKKVGGIK